jgi:hypothetical protein
VVFLCGRPGCGRESSATLQIDAPSMTITLVDPRVSRDGIPLCAHHADATTPPMGWTMNDLRSENRAALAPVRSISDRDGSADAEPSSERSHRSPEADERGEAALFRRTDPEPDGEARTAAPQRPGSLDDDSDEVDDDPLRFSVSRQLRTMPVTARSDSTSDDLDDSDPDGQLSRRSERSATSTRAHRSASRRSERAPGGQAGEIERSDPKTGRATGGRGRSVNGRGAGARVRRNPPPTPPMAPASRPAKRRDAESDIDESPEEPDAAETDDDKFPWHHHFEDDEPAELQAKSRLLSRAFRSSVG